MIDIDKANVALAEESAMLRGLLSELVAAVDGILEKARPYTEAEMVKQAMSELNVPAADAGSERAVCNLSQEDYDNLVRDAMRYRALAAAPAHAEQPAQNAAQGSEGTAEQSEALQGRTAPGQSTAQRPAPVSAAPSATDERKTITQAVENYTGVLNADQEVPVGVSEEIVGHKTFATGDPLQPFRHESLTRAEADEIWKRVEEERLKREQDMPTEQDALRTMVDAYHRLIELGWAQAMYCPKDGSTFLAIEPGSSGVHDCHYSGEWPDGSWWIAELGDLWPSRPCLWKAKNAAPSGDNSDA